MGSEGSGSGKKVGLIGCLVFWALAVGAYIYLRKTPFVTGTFAAVRSGLDWLKGQDLGWLAAILGAAVASPAALIWWLWRRYKRRREGRD